MGAYAVILGLFHVIAVIAVIGTVVTGDRQTLGALSFLGLLLLFDLAVGDWKIRPDAAAGYAAAVHPGRLEQVGTPQDVYDFPASSFVAQFIGTPPMNLLQPGQMGSADVRVGIRPEHLLLAADGVLEGTVRQVEHLGHEVLLLTESAGGRLTARVAPHADLPVVGDTVRFDVAPNQLHRFDAVTGVRVP